MKKFLCRILIVASVMSWEHAFADLPEGCQKAATAKLVYLEALTLKGQPRSYVYGKFKLTNQGSEVLVLEGWLVDEGFRIHGPYAYLETEQKPGVWNVGLIRTGTYLAPPNRLTVAPGASADILVSTYQGEGAVDYQMKYRVVIMRPLKECIVSGPFLLKLFKVKPSRISLHSIRATLA